MNHLDVFDAIHCAVTAGRSASFSLQDIAPEPEWLIALRSPTSHSLVTTALSGALAALEGLGVTSVEVECCSIAPPGGLVLESDMTLARRWLAEGVRGVPRNLHSTVTDTIAARGWLNHSARITSLILAIYAVAAQAGEKTRSVLDRAS